MNALIPAVNTVTMTSLELVQFINNQRDEGEAELRHDHFMAKVPKVLGEGAPKFRDTYINNQNGQTYPCYRFPKREYVKGILRKRLSYVPYDVVRTLEPWVKAGVSVEDMVDEAKYTRSWNAFLDWLRTAEESANG